MKSAVFLVVSLFLSLSSPLLNAGELEVKVSSKPVKLPYWPADSPNFGAVIIVNGGLPIEWFEPLDSLAQALAKNGWSTVILNGSPEIPTPWLTILPEAISTLRQNKNKRIIIIHYDEQLNMTLDYFSKPQGKGINGLILLSATDLKPTTIKVDALKFPLFDIIGQFDYDEVRAQLKLRKELFKSPTYKTMVLPGADHGYDYTQDMLAAFLSGWMLKIPETTVAAPPINSKTGQSYIEPIYPFERRFVALAD